MTVEDGMWAVAMGLAAHRSIDEGRAIGMAELGPEFDTGSTE